MRGTSCQVGGHISSSGLEKWPKKVLLIWPIFSQIIQKKGACPGYSTPLARLAAGRSCQGRSQEFDLGVYGKTPSAEGARIKAPQAPSSEAPQAPRGVRCGEGVCGGEGVGRGYAPSQKFFEIFTPKWWVLVQYEVQSICNGSQPAFPLDLGSSRIITQNSRRDDARGV